MALGHLSETLLLFSPMGVSSVESWDTMLTTVPREQCRPLRETVVTGLAAIFTGRTPQNPSKRGQQNFVRGQVNHVSVEQVQNDSGVVLGTFPINSIPTTVLFDSGASYSFITDQFVTKHNLSMSAMKNPLIVSSPGGEMKTGYICPQVKINIM
jgi:hypothetical protein